jgi:hypothetical protein
VKEIRAYLLLRSRPERHEGLRRAREEVRAQVAALAERYAEPTGQDGVGRDRIPP